MTDHTIAVLATRHPKDDSPSYRALCSCRRFRGAYRPLTKAGYALAEHDGREHARGRADVQAATGGGCSDA